MVNQVFLISIFLTNKCVTTTVPLGTFIIVILEGNICETSVLKFLLERDQLYDCCNRPPFLENLSNTFDVHLGKMKIFKRPADSVFVSATV